MFGRAPAPSLRLLRTLAHLKMSTNKSSSTTTTTITTTTPLTVAVICPPDNQTVLLTLPQRSDVSYLVANDIDTFQAHPDFKNIRAIMYVAVGGRVELLPTLFDALALDTGSTSVQWVHSLFAGVDALGPFIASHLRETNIPLTNGRGAFSESLAEYVLASALHFNKKISTIQTNHENKKWDKFVMSTLKGKTMGFVGYGHIGTTTARLAKAFGMNVLALRRNTSKKSEYADHVFGQNEKIKLFQESDIVVSVLPGTEETKNYCGAAEFQAMKQSGVFISVGRGLVVDEDALCNALDSNEIAGAALDVFKTEPLPLESRLWSVENDKILLTAHNADFTEDYFRLGWNIFEQNLNIFIASDGNAGEQEMITPVDKDSGY